MRNFEKHNPNCATRVAPPELRRPSCAARIAPREYAVLFASLKRTLNDGLCNYLHLRGQNYKYLLPVQPYSLYQVVFVTLDAGERPFQKIEKKKKTCMKFLDNRLK